MPTAEIKNITKDQFKLPTKRELIEEKEEFEVPLGQRIGGLSIYRNKFKRGAGANVFGSDENGIWLGAAEFATAPFRVAMNGDVTATSITLTGYIADGGAAADVNANATTISGGKITTGSITATQIAAGTITATQIAAGTITANEIAAGSLVVGTNVGLGTAQDSAGVTTIIGNTVTTGYINALSITVLGAVTAGSLSGLTITGGTIRTSASGSRIQLDGSNDRLVIYDSNGTLVGAFNSDAVGTLRISKSDSDTSAIKINSGGDIILNNSATAGADIQLFSDDAIYVNSTIRPFGGITTADLGTSSVKFRAGYFSGALVAATLDTGQGAYELYAMNQNVRTTDSPTFSTVNADIIQLAGGGYVDDARAFYFETGRTTNPTISGEIRYYDSAGTKQFRGYINGFTGSFDMTSI